ncbi:glycoside hydrolase family 31 protein [Xylona heveae TC161]|uniref:Glycoside hydrolase family 31 protein n=1 Tax=Xylona heveae (strain CBS 132557 / TC161) TaxID=1328760 RepID=A0A164ZHQ2_XYLHT|nr:glycoside hydrolase family 31 protein [Xylona heveae TC161]KZF19115.1 glycoside hydrolase family 31 protein [Xylona heveae TC161]
MKFLHGILALSGIVTLALADCPGYIAYNVAQSKVGLTADLKLAGPNCNAYGWDFGYLKLLVEYQSTERLHVMIYDPNEQVYQVPTFIVPRPDGSSAKNDLEFDLTPNPFSFAVRRKSTGETLFDTKGAPLIFESQYLGLRTALPNDPNIYGLGEHSDPFRLNSTNYIRTLWSRDAYTIPAGTNLYGNHPIYFDHRMSGTHGVFLLNSNGMDIKINNDPTDGQYLEYNTNGGVLDFYFLSGPNPTDVATQYSEIIGKSTMMPYWGFGFHQCRYGYQDVYEVASVVYNYSQAGIPLETMWTDIDYMNLRQVFTLDPERFPLEKMQELVTYLHDHDQHYVLMVDPAVAYMDYPPFNLGQQEGIFMEFPNGTIFQGVVWPGITAFPDWFHPNTQGYWNTEFDSFFNADTGVNIDALWIDMNEASNFCPFPCANPAAFAVFNSDPPTPPPVRANPRPLPGFPADFQPPNSTTSRIMKRQADGSKLGISGRDLLTPPYYIHNAAGALSMNTIRTDLYHSGGYADYDVHNLYGTMMSSTSYNAMLSRRPNNRPLVITRSTYAGAGTKVGHWLGDNVSTWDKYRISISGLLQFASLYQVPMVGSDVCGYAGDTTEELCARWAMLGAFSGFYRNHNSNDSPPQEFYRWASVTAAAKKAINARYQLLDYFYTAFQQQSVSGVPAISPMWFPYPTDTTAPLIELQYFFGPSILISPVTDEGATSVSIYLPNDQFYDFWTLAPVTGTGSYITLSNLQLTDIPIHIRGGSIIPMRAQSANTTTALRQNNFNLIVAPGTNNKATGSLYIDDGDSLVTTASSTYNFNYAGKTLTVSGVQGYDVGNLQWSQVTVLGVNKAPKNVKVNGNNAQYTYNANSQSVTVTVNVALKGAFALTLQ